MNLSAPTKPVFLISLVLAIVAVVLLLAPTIMLSLAANAFWILLVGYVILLLGNLIRDF